MFSAYAKHNHSIPNAKDIFMAKTKKKKATALVLQGGGALGAYEFGVVKALYENSDFAPDIVCGVSIGGFSAAVIGGAKDGPVKGLQQLWDMFTAINIG